MLNAERGAVIKGAGQLPQHTERASPFKKGVWQKRTCHASYLKLCKPFLLLNGISYHLPIKTKVQTPNSKTVIQTLADVPLRFRDSSYAMATPSIAPQQFANGMLFNQCAGLALSCARCGIMPTSPGRGCLDCSNESPVPDAFGRNGVFVRNAACQELLGVQQRQLHRDLRGPIST